MEAASTTLAEDALAAGKRMASRLSSTRLFILRECLPQVFRRDSIFSTDGRNLQGYRVHIHKEDAVIGIMLQHQGQQLGQNQSKKGIEKPLSAAFHPTVSNPGNARINIRASIMLSPIKGSNLKPENFTMNCHKVNKRKIIILRYKYENAVTKGTALCRYHVSGYGL
ncbi:hypothetical protein PSENEW3_00005728 [Picochlorum sp. SENEW3]|nr:hypothetical protein PSENEW3_00005728 [Picochlorum sp. SENEW3]